MTLPLAQGSARFVWFAILLFAVSAPSELRAQSLSIANRAGLRLAVSEETTCPALRLFLPRGQGTGGILIVYPEHVTVLEHGQTTAKHLYLWRPGQACKQPVWRQAGNSLEYEVDLEDNIHMLARATLESDGVRYHFELVNHSGMDYDWVEAIWDPRLNQSIFRDIRLERTYVHRDGRWQPIASDTPARLTMPLNQWLPVRYLDSYTWPVPPPDKRIVKDQGITYINASRPVDLPVIATLSQNKRWLAASYSKQAGNVWTNPELTCQHVNPQVRLAPWGRAGLDGETYVFQGTLDQLLQRLR